MGECKIEQDMSMTEYEKIDFIRFPKFFGKAYQVLVFLALIFGVVISGLSTMGRPSQCKSNGPPGVYGRVKILAEAVSKYFSEENDGTVKIEMTLTAPNCPAADFIIEDVRMKVESIENVKNVDIQLVFEPEWDKDMMSEEAKLELGLL